jgi:flavin-dependent dehydrogenase
VHDVVIVGASIAGAATAIHLARLGRSVHLIDQATFPRRKACGEGLFSRGVAELAALGVLADVQPHAAPLSSIRLHLRERSAEASFMPSLYQPIGIERQVLDDALLRLACALGVEVTPGLRATGLIVQGPLYTAIQTDGGSVPARAFVAADGLRSRLRHFSGLDLPVPPRRYRYGVSGHYHLAEAPPPRIEVYALPGYEVYLTPVGAHRLNVALLLGRKEARSLSGRLVERYEALVAASDALPEGASLVDEPIAAGPFPAGAERLWRANLVLAGDAAGFLDPINGEGMSHALISARLCAEAVHAYLADEAESHFAAYERRQRALARDANLVARLMLISSTHPALGAWALRNLNRHPETLARLVAVNQGERRISSLSARDVLAIVAGI